MLLWHVGTWGKEFKLIETLSLRPSHLTLSLNFVVLEEALYICIFLIETILFHEENCIVFSSQHFPCKCWENVRVHRHIPFKSFKRGCNRGCTSTKWFFVYLIPGRIGHLHDDCTMIWTRATLVGVSAHTIAPLMQPLRILLTNLLCLWK